MLSLIDFFLDEIVDIRFIESSRNIVRFETKSLISYDIDIFEGEKVATN